MKPNIKTLLKGYSYVNSNITVKNFPLPKNIETKDYKIIEMGKSFSSQEALDRIKKEKGYHAATIWEMAQWKIEHESEIKGGYKWYLAFGSIYKDADGYHRVPYVGAGSDGGLRFSLGSFEGDWDDSSCLLLFCDKPSKSLKLKKSDTLNLSSRVEYPIVSLESRLKSLESWKAKVEKVLVVE